MTRPLSVALVHPYSFPEVRRGGERYLADEAWYLAGAGHRVTVITGTTGPSRTESIDGIAYVRLHCRERQRLRDRSITVDETFGAVAFSRLVRQRFDVVHAYTPTAAIAGRLSGHRTVYTVLGHPTADALAGRRVYRRLFVRAVRSATVAVALSRASAQAAAELFGCPVDVLSPGVRLDRFPLRGDPRTGPPAILFSAFADDRRKGVDVALAALADLLETRPDARLRLSGAGDFRWACERLGVRAPAVLGATDDLGVGTLDEIPARYRDATVTVLPSRDEAFGLALVESLASGTPAVCSDSGGMAEIVSDAGVGRVFPVGDAAALARALDETIALAADPATPVRCAGHARRWGWAETIGPLHESLLAELAGRTRRAVGAAGR